MVTDWRLEKNARGFRGFPPIHPTNEDLFAGTPASMRLKAGRMDGHGEWWGIEEPAAEAAFLRAAIQRLESRCSLRGWNDSGDSSICVWWAEGARGSWFPIHPPHEQRPVRGDPGIHATKSWSHGWGAESCAGFKDPRLKPLSPVQLFSGLKAAAPSVDRMMVSSVLVFSGLKAAAPSVEESAAATTG